MVIIKEMPEYRTQAIVLDKEPVREQDAVAHLFTKSHGRVAAKLISGRKITSKLAAHFEPNRIVTARLVEKGSVRAVDGVCIRKLNLPWGVMLAVKELAPPWEADAELYALLSAAEQPTVTEMLAYLGYDPRFSFCLLCGKTVPEYFLVKEHEFACRECLPSFMAGGDEVIYIRE